MGVSGIGFVLGGQPVGVGRCRPGSGLTSGPPPALRLAILGDSSAAGVGARQQEEALAGQLVAFTGQQLSRQVSWRLVARSGATARSVQRDLVPSLTVAEPAWNPDLVVVVVGGNDLTHGRPIPAWRRDMRALIGAIRREAGPVPIVLAGLPPFLRLPSLPQPLRTVSGLRARAMDDVLRRMARDSAAVWHVPSATLPAEGDDFFTEDGFHLAARGYRAWAEVIAHGVADAAEAIIGGLGGRSVGG
jgi:lysophospholipase L1-like esterase